MLNVKPGARPPSALGRFRRTLGHLCFWVKFPTPHTTLSCPPRSSHKHLLSVSPNPHVFVQSLKCKLHESRKRICFILCFIRARTVPWTQYMVGHNKLCCMNKQISGGPKGGIKGLKKGREESSKWRKEEERRGVGRKNKPSPLFDALENLYTTKSLFWSAIDYFCSFIY